MAEQTIDSEDYLLFIKENDAATAWLAVACLTSNGVQLNTAEKSTTSKCSGKYDESKPGRKSWTMSASGQAIDVTGQASRASYQKLRELWKSDTTFPVKMTSVNDPSIVTRGSAFITSLSDASETDGLVTFDVSLKGVGEPLFTAEAP